MISDRVKVEQEFEFNELLSKISEFQVAIRIFKESTINNSLTQLEQQQIFSLFETLTKDLYCEADKLYTNSTN